MRALFASELLHVWEQGLGQPLFQRALMLVAVACPEHSPAQLATLSIGQRDACLLRLREQTFGTQLACLVNCPQCGAQLELAVNTADLRMSTSLPPLFAQSEGQEDDSLLSFCVKGYTVRFRLPNSLDLGAISEQREVCAARQMLLTRCLCDAERNGEHVAVGHLPMGIIEAVVEHMAQVDPQADLQFALVCSQCEHRWQATFDIARFFWSELTTWAHRILNDVHVLASAYGWRESDILTLSPWRRQYYLNLVSG